MSHSFSGMLYYCEKRNRLLYKMLKICFNVYRKEIATKDSIGTTGKICIIMYYIIK